MDLEALGNLGDFIGGLAVVVTLGYLAVQVRQNTRQLERSSEVSAASAYQGTVAIITQINSRVSADRDLAELVFRGQDGLANLDEIDQYRYMAEFTTIFRLYESMNQQHEAGLVSQDQHASLRNRIRRHLSRAGTREVWARTARDFTPGFRNLVETILGESSQPDTGAE